MPLTGVHPSVTAKIQINMKPKMKVGKVEVT